MGVDEMELFDDIPLHVGRGSRGECDGGGVSERLAQSADSSVIGAKIVPPFAYAVSLINCNTVNRTF